MFVHVWCCEARPGAEVEAAKLGRGSTCSVSESAVSQQFRLLTGTRAHGNRLHRPPRESEICDPDGDRRFYHHRKTILSPRRQTILSQTMFSEKFQKIETNNFGGSKNVSPHFFALVLHWFGSISLILLTYLPYVRIFSLLRSSLPGSFAASTSAPGLASQHQTWTNKVFREV